jgi:hypothetical protein
MVDEATMSAQTYPRDSGNGRQETVRERDERSPDVARVGGDIGELVENISTLVELQAQLLSVDLKSMVQRAIAPAVLGVVGLVLLLGTIPVLLSGIGWLLVEEAGWSTGPALLAVAGIAIVVAAAMCVAAALLLKNITSAFDRSRAELTENIRWIKAAFNRRRIRERNLL